MLELLEAEHGKVLIAEVSGTFTKDDFMHFLPEAEHLIKKHGTIRVLCLIRNSPRWELGALWEEAKFDLKHFRDIERLAIFGHQKWQLGMALFCKPFTQSNVRHFDQKQFDEAVQWLWADLPLEATARFSKPASANRTTRSTPAFARSHSSGRRKIVSEETIRIRAYQKWEAAGKANGDDLRFWFEAEREILQRN